jgi:hypothetical protein
VSTIYSVVDCDNDKFEMDRDHAGNLFVSTVANSLTGTVMMTPDEAKALRDVLIAHYPLPAAAPQGASPWRVVESFPLGGVWHVVRDVPSSKEEHIASISCEADAQRIADALNAQEGN